MKISLASLGEEPTSRFLEQVQFAELLGFYAFGHSDEKWTRDMWVRLSAVAALTTRIGLYSIEETRHEALQRAAA
jgi:alkanesulfonate monooxygenase SsuD/methylene tetrahydromethanopterin reductase-like flavin-dependent oxidoreductase (luciferase family)